MTIKENLLFLQGFFKHPKRVGNIIPSSTFLSAKMVQPIPWHEVKTVAELGSGTGAITRYIQAQLTGPTKVFLFERDKHMRFSLKYEFPEYILHSNASYLVKKLKQEGIRQLDCIICGLPFFNFSSEMREYFLHQIRTALKPGGTFIAYQYSLQMKRHFAKDFIIENIDFVPFNFPPAFVYTCRKRETL
ncbi:methyltransferase domain-containing protein [Paenibacillus sp. JX-17]|uniref:Methyltransferase domain-containing protein n=1 Tax=Paenibacillus lacisoli TaxID=3064525 RepID=A0ABT9C7B2_9BACL|nr:methyltransferase domain-containing protein [Paenibacillus sp. JX-17]MDO7904795.1 methyltransferase domain-containing protein [Paenibacillus sp. JX-17]